MIATSVNYRGHRCFTKDFAGFETVQPINVIIGRNNTGKSHLLDFAEALCSAKVQIAGRDWECQCEGELEERDLRQVFSHELNGGDLIGNHWGVHGHFYIGKRVSWTATNAGGVTITHLQVADAQPNDYTAAHKKRIEQLLSNAQSLLAGSRFRRLLADRDIQPEPENPSASLGQNGRGATNLIRRYLSSTSPMVDRQKIQIEMRAALNEIYAGDGHFTEVLARHHDEQNAGTKQGHWEIYLGEEKKQLVPLSLSGSGLKTVILVLLNLFVVPHSENMPHGKYVFAFEELENNLHPALLRRLFRFLESFALEKKTTIFLTTHSSVALDVFGLSGHAQIIHVTHDGESARAETVATHFDRHGVVSELGAKPSDLMQANGILWVEGPSDRIYLNRWIELVSDGKLREGRDYQCAFYGGALLARTQFTSPDEADTELANLLRLNHNIIVVCDSDRTSKTGTGAEVKERVQRITAEVSRIPGAHSWITSAKEIENYLPGLALAKVFDVDSIPDPSQFERFFPSESTGRKNNSFVQTHLKRKAIDKVELALKVAPHMTLELLKNRFDWAEQLMKIVERIRSWN